MPLGHGNPDASIAYYGKKNRPRKNGIHTGKPGPRRLSFALVRLALPNRIRIVGQAFLLAAGIQIRQAGALALQRPEGPFPTGKRRACPAGERMGGRKRMVPCAANSRYYPSI